MGPCMGATGSVTKIWCLSGRTGISTPAIALSWPDQAPPALTTVFVATGPRVVSTPTICPLLRRMAVTSVKVCISTPRRRAALA